MAPVDQPRPDPAFTAMREKKHADRPLVGTASSDMKRSLSAVPYKEHGRRSSQLCKWPVIRIAHAVALSSKKRFPKARVAGRGQVPRFHLSVSVLLLEASGAKWPGARDATKGPPPPTPLSLQNLALTTTSSRHASPQRPSTHAPYASQHTDHIHH